MPREQIYCSLDIETSGFDPEKNEILEVGFVLFKIEKNKIKITEEWTQVFRPAGEVPEAILALTGITKKELEEAPQFKEHRKFLQEKLGMAVILGHNIIFDIHFLESFGIKFQGGSIDTLDLVQFILPTAPAYNLESLMHYFGISHKEAHRALADSKATLKVLEELLGIYQSFPEKLKKEIGKQIKTQKFIWEEFLNIKIKKAGAQEKKQSTKIQEQNSLINIKIEAKKVFDLPLKNDSSFEIARSLKEKKKEILLVMPKIWQVMKLWKAGLVQPIFLGHLKFNKPKFNEFLEKKDKTAEEIMFALKILVWEHVNWQTETILDLNLSFFGGQFKEFIIGGSKIFNSKVRLLCCDIETLLSLEDKKKFEDRFLLIYGLCEFEQQISSNISTKVSWGYINYLLKSVYNPEVNSGVEKYKKEVMEGLVAGDLFFGLVNALLKTSGSPFQYLTITPGIEESLNFIKVKDAGKNYSFKLNELNKKLKLDGVVKFAENLKKFFEGCENRVRWIELFEKNTVFYNSPVKLKGIVKNFLENFKSSSFIDNLNSEKLFKYYKKRLSLETYSLKKLDLKKTGSKGITLFNYKSSSPKVVKVKIVSQIAGEEELKSLLEKKYFPTALLFPNMLKVKEFYNKNYEELKSKTSVLAQGSSGGSNKLFRNFQINPKSLLIASDKYVLKFLKNKSVVNSTEQLRVKTLILNSLPFEQFTHPYYEAVAGQFEDSFVDYSLPLALNNLKILLKFFDSDILEKIYFFEPKFSKGYSTVFVDFLKDLPKTKLL